MERRPSTGEVGGWRQGPWLWLVVLPLAGVILSLSDFHSRSANSEFYSGLIGPLSERPIREWIAPKWGTSRYSEPPDSYIRDHVVGHLIPAVLLARLGMPPRAALTLAQMVFQVLALYALVALAAPYFGRATSSALLWGLQLTPIAIVFGIRANHEQQLLFFMVLALIGAVRTVHDLRWALLVAAGMNGALVTKGALALLVPVIVAVPFLVTLRMARARRVWQCVVALVAALASALVTAWIYELAFRAATGLEFWAEYWRVQIVGRSGSPWTEPAFAMHKLRNLGYYLGRIFHYSLPWTLLACWIALRAWARRSGSSGAPAAPREKTDTSGSLLVLAVLAGVLLYLVVFSQFQRYGSRYIFPAIYLSGAMAVLVSVRGSRRLAALHQRILRAGVHHTAAALWFALFVLHLVLQRVR